MHASNPARQPQRRPSQTFRKQPLAVAVAAAISASLGAAPLIAATGDNSRATIEEVTVTATRRSQSVQEVPYNISAVSGADIEAAQIYDNADLMRGIPGVSVVDRGHRNSGVINGIMIRGLNIDGSALGDYALSAVPTVSTYVNDSPVYANFLLRDIERVEVLRGPQGTLYGSGSLGGTVRYILREPVLGERSLKLSAFTSSIEGSDGLAWNTEATGNLPLGDKAALRVLVGRLDQEGIVDYRNVYVLDANGVPVAPNGVLAPDAEYREVEDADDVDIRYARVALRLEPNERIDAVLSWQHQEDDVGGRRQETVGLDGWGQAYDDYENGSVQLEPSSREVDVASLEVDVDLGFATLTSSTSWYDHEGDSTSENTGFYAQAGFLSFYYNYPRPMASAERTFGNSAWVQELRLASNGNNTVDWVVGAFWMDQDLESTQQSFLRGFKTWWDAFLPAAAGAVTGDKDFDYRRDETFEDRALFGEATWHLSPSLRITGGLRWFDNKFSNDTFMDLPLYASFSDPTNASFDTEDDDVLFKINAAWDLTEEHMVYATVSEGYRRGGSNAVPLNGTFAEDPGWQRYSSDTVLNTELGIKGSFPSLRYNISLFQVDWEDVQVNTATTNWGFFAALNGDDARTRGLELEVEGLLGEHWGYNLGYAYVDAEITSDIFAPDNSTVPRAVDGTQLPGTPDHSLNAALEYHTTFTSGMANGLGLRARLDSYHQSSSRNAINNSDRFNVGLDAFSIWNTAVTLSGTAWDATLYVRNIGNEEGVTGLFTEAYMGTAPGIGYFGNGNKQFLSLPRTIGLQVNWRI